MNPPIPSAKVTGLVVLLALATAALFYASAHAVVWIVPYLGRTITRVEVAQLGVIGGGVLIMAGIGVIARLTRPMARDERYPLLSGGRRRIARRTSRA